MLLKPTYQSINYDLIYSSNGVVLIKCICTLFINVNKLLKYCNIAHRRNGSHHKLTLNVNI